MINRVRQGLASEFLAIYSPEDCLYHLQGWLDWRYTIARFQEQHWKLNIDGKIGGETRFSISYAEAGRYGSIIYNVAQGIIKPQDKTSSLIRLEPYFADNSISWLIPGDAPTYYKWLVENIAGILNNPKLGGVNGYHPIPLYGKRASKDKNS
jgi:hypothetical protein